MSDTASRPTLARLALALCAAAVSLALVEAVLRFAVERPLVTSEWILYRPSVLDSDSVLSPWFARTDAHYERDADLPTVVLLGDSFTEGYPVDRAEAYPARLRAGLAARGISANVIDMGVGDTGPDQHMRLLEREVLPRFTPDVIVWQFYPNDEWNSVDRAVYRIDEGALRKLDVSEHWLLERQRMYERFPFGPVLARYSYLFRYLLKSAERRRTDTVDQPFADVPRAWAREKFALHLDRLEALADQHEMKTYLVLVAPEGIVPGFDTDTTRRDWIEAQNEAYAHMLDTLASKPNFLDARFLEDDGVTMRSDVYARDGRDAAPPGARHYNETGYGLITELVLDRLVADAALE